MLFLCAAFCGILAAAAAATVAVMADDEPPLKTKALETEEESAPLTSWRCNDSYFGGVDAVTVPV